MTQKNKIATVFGGTGFVGKQIVRSLAAQGMIVKIATRIPEKAALLKHCGNVGQIVPVACRYSDPQSIADALAGSDYVVNCIGILYERGKKKSFKRMHNELPEMIAKVCMKAGVRRFVHISALGCDVSKSHYAKSKFEGEKAVLSAFPRAIILRPGIIFGIEDDFFNKFAEFSRYLPFLPLIGGGNTKFQPVYVGDVAKAVEECFNPQGRAREGKVYELGGTEVLTFRQVYEKIFDYTQRRRLLIRVPFSLAAVKGFFCNALMPNPILTPDQVESLKTDSVVRDQAFNLRSLGIVPVALDCVLPDYLPAYRRGGR